MTNIAPEPMRTFPVFLLTSGKQVIVVGGGEEALAKCRLLAQTDVQITIVAPHIDDDLLQFVDDQPNCSAIPAKWDKKFLRSQTAVFAATGKPDLDSGIVNDARQAKIPANAVDRPDLCDFFVPSFVNRAPLVVAIGTEGTAPVLGQKLRAKIDAMLSPSLGTLARLAAGTRHRASQITNSLTRRRFWQTFFNGEIEAKVAHGDIESARQNIEHLLTAPNQTAGRVFALGLTANEPDLLTLRAHRALMSADVIAFDQHVPSSIIEMGRRDAHQWQISSITDLVSFKPHISRGLNVVWISSSIFASSWQMVDGLAGQNMPFEVLPSIHASDNFGHSPDPVMNVWHQPKSANPATHVRN